jgi:hypothetical protein
VIEFVKSLGFWIGKGGCTESVKSWTVRECFVVLHRREDWECYESL